MRLIRNPELKGILGILLIALVLGIVLAGVSGKLEQWGLPWFTGARVFDKIIFVSDISGTREIYSMNLDGSDRRQLTKGASVLSAPAITPAGNRIVFIGMCGSTSHVMAVGANGGTWHALTTSTGSKRQPEFSPDGKKLAYIEAGRVYVAELNGSNPDPVLPTHAEMAMAMGSAESRGAIPLYSAYSWAPDSEGLAGVSSPDRMTDTLKYLPKPNGDVVVVTPPAPMMHVNGIAWAAKEAVLAATVQLGRDALVLAFYPQQKRLDVLTRVKDITLGAPAIAPDGSVVIVPVVGTTNKQEAGLARIDVDTKKSGMLCVGEFEKPVYSPDGSRILAAQLDRISRKRAIVTIDPDSGEITRLTHEGDCFDAVFSPMSKH